MAGKGDTPRQVNWDKWDKSPLWNNIGKKHGPFKGNADKPRDVSVHPTQESWRSNKDKDKP